MLCEPKYIVFCPAKSNTHTKALRPHNSMKRPTDKASNELHNEQNPDSNFKRKRQLIAESIAMEVDLQNRQIFFNSDIRQKLQFELETNNVDQLINAYISPEDSQQVFQQLTEAERGMEKPISFNFVHPFTSRSFKFEYRYQIIYVKYASTRLQGELIRKK